MDTHDIVNRLLIVHSMYNSAYNSERGLSTREWLALRDMYTADLVEHRPGGTYITDLEHLKSEVKTMYQSGLSYIGCIRFVCVAAPEAELRSVKGARDFVRDECDVFPTDPPTTPRDTFA